MSKGLSIHPKLAAVVDAVLNIIMLWWLEGVIFPWVLLLWVVFRLVIWGVAIKLMYFPAGASRARMFGALALFGLGMLSFIIFTEWGLARLLFEAMFVVFPFLSFWLLPASEVGVVTLLKPHSRLNFMMCVLGLAGLFAWQSAISEFQLFARLSIWFWLVFVSLSSTAVACWWWWEYGAVVDQKFYARALVWFTIFLEFLWVMSLLPHGYLAASFILIWVWYVLWLLFRFSLSAEGIKWRKQALFLGANAILFAAYLFLAVKWR